MTTAHVYERDEAPNSPVQSVDLWDGFHALDVGKARERIRFHREHPGALFGLSWGYPSLDDITDGLAPDDCVFLGARPGMGKSFFALQVSLEQIKAGKRVAFFALEMSEAALANRLAAMESGIPLEALKKGRIFDRTTQRWTQTPEEWYDRFDQTLEWLQHLRLFLVRSGQMSSDQMRSIVRRMKRNNRPPALVVVDHIGLVSDPGKEAYNRITAAVVNLATTARDEEVPHLVISHVKRDVSERKDPRPTMTDFADTGAIEKNATILAYIHRDSAYAKPGDQPVVDRLEVGILKNREGRGGTTTLNYLTTTGRMYEPPAAEEAVF